MEPNWDSVAESPQHSIAWGLQLLYSIAQSLEKIASPPQDVAIAAPQLDGGDALRDR